MQTIKELPKKLLKFEANKLLDRTESEERARFEYYRAQEIESELEAAQSRIVELEQEVARVKNAYNQYRGINSKELDYHRSRLFDAQCAINNLESEKDMNSILTTENEILVVRVAELERQVNELHLCLCSIGQSLGINNGIFENIEAAIEAQKERIEELEGFVSDSFRSDLNPNADPKQLQKRIKELERNLKVYIDSEAAMDVKFNTLLEARCADKDTGMSCACSYDDVNDLCMYHSPKLVEASARIKELEAALEEAAEDMEQESKTYSKTGNHFNMDKFQNLANKYHAIAKGEADAT